MHTVNAFQQIKIIYYKHTVCVHNFPPHQIVFICYYHKNVNMFCDLHIAIEILGTKTSQKLHIFQI